MTKAFVTGHFNGAIRDRRSRNGIRSNANVSVEQWAAKLKTLESKYQNLQDVHEIENLQRIYGYYIERGQLDEVADLFSTCRDVATEMSGREQKGIENIRKTFSSATPFGVMVPGTKPADYLHVTAPISGVVDVHPRWQNSPWPLN